MSDEEYAEYVEQERDIQFEKILEQSLSPSRLLLDTPGPVERLDELYAAGAELEARDPFTGDTPLTNAVQYGSITAAKWLLSKGAPWWRSNGGKRNSLHIAWFEGEPEMIKLIYEWAVEIEYKHFYGPVKTYDECHPIDRTRHNKIFLKEPCFYMELDPDGRGGGRILDDGGACILRPLPGHTVGGEGEEPKVQVEKIMVSGRGSGVMMDWELPIMEESARQLMEGLPEGASVLNIGFGLGLIDAAIQKYKPARHVILEPQRNALIEMQKTGWHKKPGVEIFQATWQDILRGSADAAAEGKVYNDMGEEFEIGTHVPRLLKGPHARFSFFHGVGQNDPAWAKVFTEVVERHLNDLGMNTQWTEVDIDRRRYWNGFVENPRPAPDVQRLVPLCMLAPTVPRTFVERDAVRFGELVCVDAVSEDSGDDSSSENSDDYAVSEDSGDDASSEDSDDDAGSEASDDYAISEDSDDDVQDGGPASERGRSASKKSEFEMPVA